MAPGRKASAHCRAAPPGRPEPTERPAAIFESDVNAPSPSPISPPHPGQQPIRKLLAAWLRLWPLTPTGLALTVLAGAALASGRREMDLVLTLAGTFGLLLIAALGLAALTVRLLFGRILRRAVEGEVHIDAIEGRTSLTGLEMPRRRWWLSAEPQWVVEQPAAVVELRKGRRTLRESVRPADRGLGEQIAREFRVSDIFGLWRFPGRVHSHGRWRVMPNQGRFDAARIESSLASGDLLAHPWGPARGDRVDSRPHTRSDPARLILWKVYARSRELLVRTPETARSPDQRPLLYLVTGDDDNPAAGLVSLIIDSGLLGQDFRFATDGSPQPVADPQEALEAVARSAAHRSRGGIDLPVALTPPGVGPDDPVVLVCPARPGPWLPLVTAELAANPARFFLFVVGDVAPDPPVRSRWQRWLLEAPPSTGLSRQTWMETARQLATTGAACVAADRRSGDLIALTAETAGLERSA